jgi:hypothetical protein
MSKHVEAVRRLAGPLDPVPASVGHGAHADPQGQATLANIISTPQPGPAARPAVKRSRAEISSFAALAAVTLALAAVLVAHAISGAGTPALAATPAPLAYHVPRGGPSGREVLLGLAAAAAGQPAPAVSTGSYGYVKTAGWYLGTRVAGGNASSAIVPSVTESWTAADGSGRVLRRTASAPAGTRLLGASTGPTIDDFRLHPGQRMFPHALSTNPRVLARQLDVGHPTRIGPVERFVAVNDLALEQPIPPKLEAAILRVLAESPGLINSGSVTDRAGRVGIAVSLDYAYSGGLTRYTLIFDSVGKLLGEEETLISGAVKLNVRRPAVISYTAFLSSGQVATTISRP